MHSESPFPDDGVGPDTRDQLALHDDLARALHQGEQDLPRAAAEAQRCIGAQQQSLLWEKPERPEL